MLIPVTLAIASDERPSGYDPPATPVPWARRGLLVAGAALAYMGGRWIGDLWRNAVIDWFHHPPFRGSWVAVEHILLYTTLSALFSWVMWWGLFKIGWMPAPGSVLRGPPRKVIVWGIGLGVVVFLVCLVALLVLHAAGAMPAGHPPLAWHPMTGWSFLGNLFSNFYEEWIFRGFLFVVAIQVTSSRVAAAVLTTALFAGVHTQYSWALRAIIFFTTLASCWVLLKLRSLWPAWIAHQVVDVLGDSVFFG
jgi:Type II CAAX prenyl endopeptidase Rce1-like